MSFLDQMERTRGRSSGFDYMRLLLACLIIALHTCTVSYGLKAQDAMLTSLAGRPLTLLVPMFFALSGFLVAGSLERCRTLVSFLGLRVLRIFPALAGQAVLSALIIGPLFTDLSLSAYGRDPLFLKFFWNAVGHTQYLLPGVFTRNPSPYVNGQLWTVPWELNCYLVLTGLALVGVVKRRWLLLLGIGALQAFLGYHAFFRPHGFSPAMSGELISLAFMWGLTLYRFRDRLPWRTDLGLAASALALALMMLPNGKYLAPLPIAYATCWLGLMDPPRSKLLLRGDYSYGLYVFGYPAQQIVASVPAFREWWINLALALPLAFAVAVPSWHLLESRVLGLRGRLMDLENWLLGVWRNAPWRRRSSRAGAPATEPAPLG